MSLTKNYQFLFTSPKIIQAGKRYLYYPATVALTFYFYCNLNCIFELLNFRYD